MLMRVIGAVVIGLFVLGATPPAAEPVEGSYICTGEHEGGKYAVALTVTRMGETYNLAQSDGGEPIAHGIGLLDGDELAVGFAFARTTPTVFGIALYRVSPGRLDGRWTVEYGVTSPETCVRAGDPA